MERVIITIETPESLTSNRHVGEHLEVKFDSLEDKNCFLSVTSDHSDWVDASFSAVMEVINKNKTKTGWVRSCWSTLTIQLLGVIGSFALSLWAAEAISPKLSIQNAFVITFFFALLLFSNAWGYLNTIILNNVSRTFPNIEFYRPDKDRLNWLMQALIAGIVTAFMLYIFTRLFSYIGDFLVQIPK